MERHTETWVVCASCGLRHSPRPDGICPRCRTATTKLNPGAALPAASGLQPEQAEAYAKYKNALVRAGAAAAATLGSLAIAAETWDKLAQLEAGRAERVMVWGPVAALYTHFGRWAAMAPFVLLCLIGIAASVAWGRSAAALRKHVPDLKSRMKEDPELRSVMHDRHGRIPARTWALIAVLGAMLAAIGLYALLH